MIIFIKLVMNMISLFLNITLLMWKQFIVFFKICMPPWRCLPSLGSKVVYGFGTLGLKGGGSASVGQVAPARLLPGL